MTKKLPLIIATLALISSLGGNLATYSSNQDSLNTINRERAARTLVVNKSELELCTKVFGAISTLEIGQLKLETFPLYKKLLPSLSNEEILNLVHNARNQTEKTIKEFDPNQCKNLPSQKKPVK